MPRRVIATAPAMRYVVPSDDTSPTAHVTMPFFFIPTLPLPALISVFSPNPRPERKEQEAWAEELGFFFTAMEDEETTEEEEEEAVNWQ